MTAAPRVTFGMIVLNGEPFIKYNLRALYPFAHQIIVVEGASPHAADSASADGHSMDDSLNAIKRFIVEEDPENKMVFVTAEMEGRADGFWPGDKDEQSQAYAKRATGDWLWQIDVDEFYQPQDMQVVLNYLAAHPEVTCLTFRANHFWGGFDYLVTGGLFFSDSFQGEPGGAYRRVFRWGEGYTYETHRPPTVRDEAGDSSDIKKTNISRLFKSMRMYHYFMVFPKQVFRKGQYYERMGWKHEENVQARYRRLFMRLTKSDRFHIFTHRGTHNWLERFEGVHPPAIDELARAIRDGSESVTLRHTDDIEKIISSPNYQLICNMYYLLESVRAELALRISLLKKQIKILLKMV